MCGIAGYLVRATLGESARPHLQAMTESIAHRGPDSSGCWIDAAAGVALGHRRLAVVDLSEAGAQPMTSASGRHVIVFNGEIYNHRDLRAELEAAGGAPTWRGQSDTETLLAAIDAWGVGEAAARTVGMFAFAVWDREMRVLTLARDRLGEKPLYYGWQLRGGEAAFLFASELRALRTHPAFEGEVDRGALTLFMRHSYIPDPHTIFVGLSKLPPGCLATVSVASPEPIVTRYWDGAAAAERWARDPLPADRPEAVIDALEALLRDAVARQMVADVPLGAFLSGGVDSSLVTALMQAQSSRPVRTFTVGFREPGFDEAGHAKRVAAHLGTDHTELYVGPETLLDVVSLLPQIYDEPFSDASQIPTYLVAQLARRRVTVALSGDGGDELFAGYGRYRQAATFWRWMGGAPQFLRGAGAAIVEAVPATAWARLAGFTGRGGAADGAAAAGQRIHRAAGYARSRSLDELHWRIVSHWTDPAALVARGREPPTVLRGAEPGLAGLGAVERMMARDMLSYLPGDVMTKVDRAAMRVSLETRAPLLDHRVVEFALRIPVSLKLRNGASKWILRQVLHRHVPAAIVERPKMGFSVPIAAWLRGPLRPWAEELLEPTRLRDEGFLAPAVVGERWGQHVSGRFDWRFQLWNVLMFQSWLENFRSESTPMAGRARQAVA